MNQIYLYRVWGSIGISVQNSVQNSIWDSVPIPVWNSVTNFICESIETNMKDKQ